MPVFYHPMRVARFSALGEKRMKALKSEAEGRIHTLNSVGASVRDIVSTLLPDLAHREFYSQMDDEERVNREHFSKQVQTTYHIFRAYGGNIFDMSRLAPLFRQADVDDLDLTGTPLPYSIFYLHFGEEAGLFVPVLEGIYVEGAYVAHMMGQVPEEQAMSLFFTCNHPDWEHADQVPFGETLRRATRVARTVLPYNLTVKEGLEKVDGLEGDPDVYCQDGVMRDAIRMAVNSVLYLSTVDPYVEERYPDGAPARLVERAGKGNLKAIRELANLGYTRLKFCGRNTVYDGDTGDGEGRTVRSHWRRGHPQRFAIGPGRAERRWQWVRQTVVNRRIGMPLNDGRIYEVGLDRPRH